MTNKNRHKLAFKELQRNLYKIDLVGKIGKTIKENIVEFRI